MIDIQPPKCLGQLAQQCGPTGTRSIRRGSSDSLSALSQTVRVFLAATAVPAASALVSTAARSLAAAAYTGLTVAATPMCTLNKNCTPRTHGREQEGPAAANPSGAPRGLAGPFTATRATSTTGMILYEYDHSGHLSPLYGTSIPENPKRAKMPKSLDHFEALYEFRYKSSLQTYGASSERNLVLHIQHGACSLQLEYTASHIPPYL